MNFVWKELSYTSVFLYTNFLIFHQKTPPSIAPYISHLVSLQMLEK